MIRNVRGMSGDPSGPGVSPEVNDWFMYVLNDEQRDHWLRSAHQHRVWPSDINTLAVDNKPDGRSPWVKPITSPDGSGGSFQNWKLLEPLKTYLAAR